MKRRSSKMLPVREVSPRAIQERGRRTWRCVCVLDDSNELRHLVLDEHVQRDVDREAGEREDRGEEGHECCEEHEREGIASSMFSLSATLDMREHEHVLNSHGESDT